MGQANPFGHGRSAGKSFSLAVEGVHVNVAYPRHADSTIGIHRLRLRGLRVVIAPPTHRTNVRSAVGAVGGAGPSLVGCSWLYRSGGRRAGPLRARREKGTLEEVAGVAVVVVPRIGSFDRTPPDLFGSRAMTPPTSMNGAI